MMLQYLVALGASFSFRNNRDIDINDSSAMVTGQSQALFSTVSATDKSLFGPHCSVVCYISRILLDRITKRYFLYVSRASIL